MSRYLRYLFACICLGVAMGGSAQTLAARVVVVGNGLAAYAQASESLVDALERSGSGRFSVEQWRIEDFRRRVTLTQLPQPIVFVTLGSQAAQAVLSSSNNTPVLSALIPQRSFEQIVRASGRKVSAQLSAIYLDQPLQRQLALLQLALPQVQQIGVLTGPDSSDKLAELGALTQARGWVLRHARVKGDEALYPALREVLDGSDVLLALADPLVFNSANIRNILLSSFRARVPMLAFSPAYERAGAVMSLYTTPSQVGAQAAREVQTLLRLGHFAERVQYPDDFEVAVNHNVARSLGLALDGDALREALRRMEGRP